MKKPIDKLNEYLLSKVSIELATGQEVKSAADSVESNIRVVNSILEDYLKLKSQWDNNGKMLISDIYQRTADDYAAKAKQLGFEPMENENYKRLIQEIKKAKETHSKASKYFK